jgi:hypothetical protein
LAPAQSECPQPQALSEPLPVSQAGLQNPLIEDAGPSSVFVGTFLLIDAVHLSSPRALACCDTGCRSGPHFAQAEQTLVGIFSNRVAEESRVEMTFVGRLWSSTSEYRKPHFLLGGYTVFLVWFTKFWERFRKALALRLAEL